MSLLTMALVLATMIFVAYAIFTYYQSTPTTGSVAARIWASLLLAGAAVAGAITSWFHSGTSP